ncbi:MAG: lytic transglycosylase domain-containing protein [Desulfuromonadaceae bacterium]|nr:lytic transglycosylase domain-containing protein [Desulfuromonadaceae bacterium]
MLQASMLGLFAHEPDDELFSQFNLIRPFTHSTERNLHTLGSYGTTPRYSSTKETLPTADPGGIQEPLVAQENTSIQETAPETTVAKPQQNEKSDIEQMIEQVAQEVDLSPTLIRSVVCAESSFRPDAVSPAGAQGLMQLMPETAKELGVADSFDPQQNLRGGSRYLKRLLDKYDGDLDHALAAYNWGQGNVDRKGLTNMPSETRHYIARVKQGVPLQV